MDGYTSIIFTHWGMDEGRDELAKKSLASLINSVKDLPTEIIVVDNGGDYDAGEYFLALVQSNTIQTYIRNGSNMSFGYARNQGLDSATGGYIAIVDNDLEYKNGWLDRCIDFLSENKDEKHYATPMQYPTLGLIKKYHKGYKECLGERWELSMRAGSNCWVMRKRDFDEVGEFTHHRIAGSKWTDQAVRKGYLAAVDPVEMVKDMGLRKGYNLSKANPIQKTLTNGKVVYLNQDEFIPIA